MDDRSARILRFLHETVDPDLTLDSELIESGLVDSFKAVTLIAFIEAEFGLRVDPGDITRVDLATGGAIVRFVAELAQKSARSD
jgi:acyl carrier protein